jgi:hypothetical protein
MRRGIAIAAILWALLLAMPAAVPALILNSSPVPAPHSSPKPAPHSTPKPAPHSKATATPTPTRPGTPTPTPTAVASAAATATPTATAAASATATAAPTASATAVASATATASPIGSATATATSTATAIPTATPTAAAIPAAYKGLYSFLQNALSQSNQVLNSVDKGQTNPITFGAELLAANGNAGPELLGPTAMEGVDAYLDALQALNVQGVTVAVSYPLILPSFPNSAEYLAFFEAVAQDVHGRGLKLDVETGPIFPEQGIAVSYKGLTAAQYAKDKNQIAQMIIDDLAPDWLNLGSEPDTEASLLSLSQLNTPAGWTAYVNGAMQGLERGGTKIAAGIGTWGNIAIADSLVKTDLDAIAIHFYPITSTTDMNVAVQVATLAHQNGKSMTMDEAWLYKSESFPGSGGAYNVFKLDPFDFWAPLDQEYLAMMVRLCQLEDIEYVSPFWTFYFFAYLDYSPTLAAESYPVVQSTEDQAGAQAIENGQTTSTGQYYSGLATGP